MDNLKRCPFCGAEAVMETLTTAMEKKPRFRVRCPNCPCDLGWDHWSVEEARDAWNKRGMRGTSGRRAKTMVDREKVIKGLECCSTLDGKEAPLCEECPYADEDTCPDLDKLHRDALELLKAQDAEESKYEYHTDHTDCPWYISGEESKCPVTCSQYRDGWNDAMNYIFRNGDGYRPYDRIRKGR